MLRSRLFEDEVEHLFSEGKLYGTTHLATGQEAAQAGLCLALDPQDWIVTTHRCHGYTVCKGTPVYPLFAELAGSRDGICRGLAGSMHFQDPERHNAGSSAIVGSGIPLATGIAFSLKRRNLPFISVSVFGDGACSRGTLHECLNLASIWNLSELFYCENNLYGMSAASSRMISTSSIASRAEGYGIKHQTVDGNDLEAVYQATMEAREYILQNHRPYFLEVLTYRQKGHSKNDRRLYRTREEEQFWAQKDPIKLFEAKLTAQGIMTGAEIAGLRSRIEKETREASTLALSKASDTLTPEEAGKLVFAPETSEILRENARTTDSATQDGKVHLSYREAIHLALGMSMKRDRNVVLIGEDIGLYGGCFKVTGDLYLDFPDQLIETPVSEESFAGLAVGAAKTGMKPIIEIMYADFATLISDPVINHAAKSYFMSAGKVPCPMVVRFPEGCGTGHGPQHTQTTESMFLNTPGLIVVAPSNPQDAYILLTQAIESNNPVMFFEHKALYNDTQDFDLCAPMPAFGKARITAHGTDLTLISYSEGIKICSHAAEELRKEGITAEILDLRTLKPLDTSSILEAARKTGRVIIVQSAPQTASVSSEVEALICSDPKTFEALKCPVVRFCACETPTPFSRTLEALYIPQVSDIVSQARAWLR